MHAGVYACVPWRPRCIYIHESNFKFQYFIDYILCAVVRMVKLSMGSGRQLTLYTTNHSTLLTSDASLLAEVTISNTSQAETSTNNLLAYRPSYNDYHSTNLAGAFINLEGVFPCLASLTNYYPICRVFTDEEDGFRNGKALIDTADIGNNIRVFSTTTNILTYGLAIQGCSEFNSTCFPIYHSFTIVCYLPRAYCNNKEQ